MTSVSGTVCTGKKRGRELGYPTINVPFSDTKVSGIFAARVYLKNEEPYMAAAFVDPERRILEAHMLDFNDDLYGTEVTIELLKKIRESATYESEAALRSAIADDIAKVREYFKN